MAGLLFLFVLFTNSVMAAKSKEFTFYSRKINYCEGESTAIEASKIRKLIALNHNGALHLCADQQCGCVVLDAGYKAYSEIVDDPNGLNNYSSRVLNLLPNNLAGARPDWKSSLTVDKVCSLLEPLPCSIDKPDPWSKVVCSNLIPTDSDVESFCQARKNFVWPIANPVNLSCNEGVPDNGLNHLSSGSKCSQKLPEQGKSYAPGHGNPNIKIFAPNVTITRRSVPGRKSAASSSGESSAPRQPESDIRGGSDREVPKSLNIKSFKTANEELRLQNLKKYGKEEGRSDGQCGAVKKSLGARKGGGVHGKFVPPILREDREGEAGGRNVPDNMETEMDERLKNIDPKMIELIRNEIMDCGPKLTWNDIAGLEFAKSTIQEIVVWPMLRPDIFTGLRRPPKGILLFGPPGTGKTLIGKCIASQSGASFFSISASSLTSKWVGDGEKMVRALFAVARVDQPSVVFIDEIDSLLSQRSDTEHESSRRLKTEFLVQLDGVGTGEEDRVLIIGATNRPQELDEAARRRLVKRLYIPLPDLNARAQMVQNLIANERHGLTESDVKAVAELTEGYSGADVKHVCQEASLGPIRSIPPTQICSITSSQVRPVDVSDFKSALTRVKSTVSPDDLNSYVKWDRQFGCGSM